MENFNYNEKFKELRKKIDYVKLDEFIEKEFIPKNLHSRRNFDDINTTRKKYVYIYLNNILNLGLGFDETQYIIYYLNNKGIVIWNTSKQTNFDIPVYYKDVFFKTNIEREEDLELFKIYKTTNDKKIRDELVKRNFGLAKSMAKKYSVYYNYDQDDIESYAFEALVIAVERFDYELGNKFSTYAYCVIDGHIKRAVLTNISNRGSKVRNNYFKISQYVRKVEEIYGISLHEDINLIQVVLDLLIDAKIILPEQREEFEKLILSIYDLSFEEMEVDIVSDGGISDVDDEIVLEQIKHIIIKFLNKKCTPNQRNVFIKRFGLDGEKPLTLFEIKQLTGLSRSRGLQLEQIVIEKLKRYLNNWPMDDYTYDDLGKMYVKERKR